MNILITTYYYYPEITPRAFRATILAEELVKKGHSVTVYTKKLNNSEPSVKTLNGVKIIQLKSGFLLNNNSYLMKSKNINYYSKTSLFHHFIYIARYLLKYIYIGGKSFEFAIILFKELFINNNIKYEIILSIGLPFSVHIGSVAKLINHKTFSIADYGDPFSINYNYFHYKYIEKFILRFFTFVSIPFSGASIAYNNIVNNKKLIIIPHFFSVDKIKLANYKPQSQITFCYAGKFYENIRDPAILFNYLSSISLDFKFIIYTDVNDYDNMYLIDKYKIILGSKLEVFPLIDRYECIFQMSKCDFLIFQNNTVKIQEPSKINDYLLTKRPIFTFSSIDFDIDLFNNYLNHNFDDFKSNIDLNKFEINNVLNDIFILYEKYNENRNT